MIDFERRDVEAADGGLRILYEDNQKKGLSVTADKNGICIYGDGSQISMGEAYRFISVINLARDHHDNIRETGTTRPDEDILRRRNNRDADLFDALQY